MDPLASFFPITSRNLRTGAEERYDTPFELWSDYEHISPEELEGLEAFTDASGREVVFKTRVDRFIEYIVHK